MEGLVDWLDDAKVLVDAGKLLGKVKAWDPESSDPDDLSDNRRQLFASREDILRCVNFSEDIEECGQPRRVPGGQSRHYG